MSKGDLLEQCSICKGGIDHLTREDGTVYWKEGHNAWPITDGKCCSWCNHTKVIPTRMKQLGMH